MAELSPVWSPWPWVTRIWVAPAIASARRAIGNIGLPVSQGSISRTARSISMRKPEWPSQVMFMMDLASGTVLARSGAKSKGNSGPMLAPKPRRG